MASPRTNGYSHAKSLFPLAILDLYSHKHLVLFLPDSDTQDRTAEFQRMEREFNTIARASNRSIRLLCCAAVPEVEAWLLAGHPDKLKIKGWAWNVIRREPSLKEVYFHPFLAQYGSENATDGGRKSLMLDGLANYEGIKQRCPELQGLEDRICEFIAGQP
jgi:hypothetical protein